MVASYSMSLYARCRLARTVLLRARAACFLCARHGSSNISLLKLQSVFTYTLEQFSFVQKNFVDEQFSSAYLSESHVGVGETVGYKRRVTLCHQQVSGGKGCQQGHTAQGQGQGLKTQQQDQGQGQKLQGQGQEFGLKTKAKATSWF